MNPKKNIASQESLNEDDIFASNNEGHVTPIHLYDALRMFNFDIKKKICKSQYEILKGEKLEKFSKILKNSQNSQKSEHIKQNLQIHKNNPKINLKIK